MTEVRKWIVSGGLVLLAAFALVSIQQRLDAHLAEFQTEEQRLYLSSPEQVKWMSLGYDGLMACLYWTRAVQHYGREKMGGKQYRLLYELLDITTTLDPKLLLAYRFGAYFLTENPPAGPGQPFLAVRLLEKGIRNNPDYWRFWYDLGFVYYVSLRDYQNAARAFQKGSEVPGAHDWMRAMAAKVAAEGGDRQTAMFLWQQLYESTDDPNIRRNALEHVQGLRVDADIEALEEIMEMYRERTGKQAASWQDLIATGLLPGAPADPTGLPYVLTPDGRFLLHSDSTIEKSEKGRRE